MYNPIKLAVNSSESKPFLSARVRETYIILQQVIKTNNQYMIVTIEKHSILKSYSILLYLPTNGKRMLVTIYFSDLAGLSVEYMASILKITGKEFEHLFNMSNCDYQKFID